MKYGTRHDVLSFTDDMLFSEDFLHNVDMVACIYFCHHLSDTCNYVDLSDLYVVLSDLYILTCHLFFVEKNYSYKLCPCPANATQTTTKLSDKLTSLSDKLTS